MMTDTHRPLAVRRPEARPLPWWDLIGQHRRALGDLLELLASAVDALAHAEELPDDPLGRESALLIRAGRSSQLAFIDGARGTGKTSVELSLRRVMRTRRGPQAEIDLAGKSAPPEVVAEVKALAAVAERIHQHLVWLAPLDMEPLPEGTNLLAALLVRIEQVVREWSRRTPQPGGWLARCDQPDDLLAALEDLRTDVVKAWDGGMPSRSAPRDLDAWSAEVLMAERARLSLDSRLSFVLERVAQAMVERGEHDPLFVYVVDDFDLSPALCVELLRVVRMVKSPRLFFIFSGDLAMVEHVMHLKSAGSASALRGQPASHDMFDARVQKLAQAVASSNLRKLVPPSHRVELSSLSVDEALAIRPGGAGPTLGESLRAWRCRRGAESVTLDALMGGPAQVPERIELLLAFFAVPVRVLVDTALRIDRAMPIDGAPVEPARFADAVAAELGLRLKEVSADALPDDKRALALQSLATATAPRELTIALGRSRMPWPTVSSVSSRSSGYNRTAVDRQPLVLWGDHPLPMDIGAGFALVHDLRVVAGRARNERLFDAIEPSMVEHVYRAVSSDDTSPLIVQWPALWWSQIAEALRFGQLWSSGVDSMSPTDDLLTVWLSAWLNVEFDSPVEDAWSCFAELLTDLTDPWTVDIEQPTRGHRVLQAVVALAPELDGGRGSLPAAVVGALEQSIALWAAICEVRVQTLEGRRPNAPPRTQGHQPSLARLMPLVSPPAWDDFRLTALRMLGDLIELLNGADPNALHPRWLAELDRLRPAISQGPPLFDGDREPVITAARRTPSKDWVDNFIKTVKLAYSSHESWADSLGAAIRHNFGAPWALLTDAVLPQASAFNAVGVDAAGRGALCPDLETLQQRLGWPAFRSLAEFRQSAP